MRIQLNYPSLSISTLTCSLDLFIWQGTESVRPLDVQYTHIFSQRTLSLDSLDETAATLLL